MCGVPLAANGGCSESLEGLQQYEKNKENFNCNKKTQDCEVVGTSMIAVHSVYVMTPEDFGEAILKHQTVIARGHFLFSSGVII